MLLGEPVTRDAPPALDPSWFVTGCPLDPDAAVEAIRSRHGFASRATALRALRKARELLSAANDPTAEGLVDLP